MGGIPRIFDLPRDDTIVAISTPPGRGALGIIRLSGPAAIEIASGLWKGSADPNEMAGGSARVGSVEPIEGLKDTAVLTLWRAPRSFTGEDIVELTLHGSPPLLDAVEMRAVDLGARPAAPGEFTLRALLNGKIGVSQAGAINALIEAPGIVAARAAARTLGGEFGRRIEPLIAELDDIELQGSAETEFPEQIEGASSGTIESRSIAIKAALDALVRDLRLGRQFAREAVVVIAGPPNVGKSTLANVLLGRQRSIVHHEPGTTRDLVEERCSFGQTAAILVDTAGLRETDDGVELIGVDIAHKRLREADLVVFVADSSVPPSREEIEALSKTEDRSRILVSNKSDLGIKREIEGWIAISALTGDGIDALRDSISRALAASDGDPIWAGTWQIERIDAAIEAVDAAIEAARMKAIDAAVTEIAEAARCLRETVGKDPPDNIIERVLDGFCIGK